MESNFIDIPTLAEDQLVHLYFFAKFIIPDNIDFCQRSGLVVESRTPNRKVLDLILTRGSVFCPWARHIYYPKILVIPRKHWLHPNMTEKLFTGTQSKNEMKFLHKNVCLLYILLDVALAI